MARLTSLRAGLVGLGVVSIRDWKIAKPWHTYKMRSRRKYLDAQLRATPLEGSKLGQAPAPA
jgi:hypothetical protein